MAGSNLLALIDDIATLLDDVAVMSKVALKKTAGVLGDDIALNAEQVAGVNADRELPVVFAVGKGSLVNKAILVPAALAISAFAPWLIVPLLMAGGTYLCFEGFEKVFHKVMHGDQPSPEVATAREAPSSPDELALLEKEKVKGAVRTDFILSAEVIVISLGEVARYDLLSQVATLVAVAVVLTVGVYGLVAAIIKMDDVGLYLSKRTGVGAATRLLRRVGVSLITAAPMLMRVLGVAGTAAMFLVGSGIFTHNIPALHHLTEALIAGAGSVPGVGRGLAFIADLGLGLLLGVAIGGVAMLGVSGVRAVLGRGTAGHAG